MHRSHNLETALPTRADPALEAPIAELEGTRGPVSVLFLNWLHGCTLWSGAGAALSAPHPALPQGR
jgi:hypothetical protein